MILIKDNDIGEVFYMPEGQNLCKKRVELDWWYRKNPDKDPRYG